MYISTGFKVRNSLSVSIVNFEKIVTSCPIQSFHLPRLKIWKFETWDRDKSTPNRRLNLNRCSSLLRRVLTMKGSNPVGKIPEKAVYGSVFLTLYFECRINKNALLQTHWEKLINTRRSRTNLSWFPKSIKCHILNVFHFSMTILLAVNYQEATISRSDQDKHQRHRSHTKATLLECKG